MSKCYLYVIWDDFIPMDTNYIKIGISHNPIKRLKNLQTGNPKALYIDRLYTFKNQNEATAIEGIIHKKLSKYRRRGEWFKFNDEIESLINSYEIFIGNCIMNIQSNNIKERATYKNPVKYNENGDECE